MVGHKGCGVAIAIDHDLTVLFKCMDEKKCNESKYSEGHFCVVRIWYSF